MSGPDLETTSARDLVELDIMGLPLPRFTAPVRNPVGTTPPRRPNSVRRTMTLDITWPDGPAGNSQVDGRARDVVYDDRAHAGSLETAAIVAMLDQRKVVRIDLLDLQGPHAEFAGLNAGGELRKAFQAHLPEQRQLGSLTHLLVDDLAGASLVSRWTPNFWQSYGDKGSSATESARIMEGLCIGFRPGSDALLPDGRRRSESNVTPVPVLVDDADPDGWHQMHDPSGMHFRRGRRIDLWRSGEDVAVECHFQDSSTAPSGGLRVGIHEYALTAMIDPAGIIRKISVTPGTLPYAACRAAPANIAILQDTPARDLRENVARYLKGTNGCTHLNDVMRSLADVPVLIAALS